MRYKVTIKPRPIVFEVESFSGKDIVEERARQMLAWRLGLRYPCLMIHDADNSDVEIEEIKS